MAMMDNLSIDDSMEEVNNAMLEGTEDIDTPKQTTAATTAPSAPAGGMTIPVGELTLNEPTATPRPNTTVKPTQTQKQKVIRPAQKTSAATKPTQTPTGNFTDTAFGSFVRRTYNEADGGGSAKGGHDRGQQQWFRRKADGSLVEETPQSERMRGLMGKGVTSLALSNQGMSWDDALKEAQGAGANTEAKRLANQAQFMQMKRDERVKRNAEMHKETYGVAKYAYDQLLGGGGEIHESKDGKKYRIVKIGGSMLEQTNADRLNMGNKDKIGAVYATIPLGSDGKTPYGEVRFDFVVEQGGNVKSGGQKVFRTMTLDQVRGNYGKSLSDSGGDAKMADTAFGSWKDRVAANAKKDWEAQNPDGGAAAKVQAQSDAAIKLANVEAQGKFDLYREQARNEMAQLAMKLNQSREDNAANAAAKARISLLENAQKVFETTVKGMTDSGNELNEESIARIRNGIWAAYGLAGSAGGSNGTSGAQQGLTADEIASGVILGSDGKKYANTRDIPKGVTMVPPNEQGAQGGAAQTQISVQTQKKPVTATSSGQRTPEEIAAARKEWEKRMHEKANRDLAAERAKANPASSEDELKRNGEKSNDEIRKELAGDFAKWNERNDEKPKQTSAGIRRKNGERMAERIKAEDDAKFNKWWIENGRAGMRKEVEGREAYKKYLERKDAERKQGELAARQNMRVGDLIRTQQDKDRKWAEKILRMKENGENVRDTEVERAKNILNRK